MRTSPHSVIEVLERLENCSRYGARFLSRSGEPTFYEYREVVQRAKAIAGTLQKGGLLPGDRIAIILPTCIQFLDIFLGTQLAGGIPAALYPPVRLGRLKEYFKRTQRMLTKIGARFLVTDSRVKKLLGPVVEQVSCMEAVLNVEKLPSQAKWSRVEVDPEGPAFLQFSSGTTVEPKAVMVSHVNLICNLEMIDSFFQRYNDEHAEYGGICWLPLYHDMGLVGCMYTGLYHPGTVTYIGPEVFIGKPKIWLQALSDYRAVISPAPDFAYGLCLAKIKDQDLQGIDLSNWMIALNGAEPIDVRGMERFCERFAQWGFREEAMTPVYGLAEAGLAVTFSDLMKKPLVTQFDREALTERGIAIPGIGRRLPSVGRAMYGLTVEIWDEEDHPLPQGRVGKITVKGPSITKGYFNDPEITRETIRSGWLDTGDLGFFYEDNLYIAGRVKDLIIIRGRNYAPQEIEELTAEIQGLRLGCTVALGHFIDGRGEKLFVLCEKDTRSNRPEEEVMTEITERILSGIGLTPHYVQLLEPGTLPRTSSGKMRRSDALRMLLNGELIPPEKMNTLKIIKEVGKSQVAWGKFWLRKRITGE